MFFLVLAGILATILLNALAIKKISNKTYKICICAANLIILILLVAFACAIKFMEKNLNQILNSQISSLEEKANEIYPDALNLQMDTTEIKQFLDESLTFESDGTLESIVANLIKSSAKDFTSFALKAIKKLERTENKLSIKEALFSLKEMCAEKADGYYKIAYAVLGIIFAIYFAFMVFLCNYLPKAQRSVNKSIVFGDESTE